MRGAGCRGEKIPGLEKGIIKADLVLVIFSCGVGVPSAQKFDEKECSSRGLLITLCFLPVSPLQEARHVLG